MEVVRPDRQGVQPVHALRVADLGSREAGGWILRGHGHTGNRGLLGVNDPPLDIARRLLRSRGNAERADHDHRDDDLLH